MKTKSKKRPYFAQSADGRISKHCESIDEAAVFLSKRKKDGEIKDANKDYAVIAKVAGGKVYYPGFPGLRVER